ncbi:unnamed protein product [Pleuronectes platessa]|uniref:Uncharacterized protein n=1 Tax=Pleuronectes platessa TaxID=8262 RepID=A0A9N7ZA49_PLEPL|nr:unnamed protein product [Pleuronectes platessa]
MLYQSSLNQLVLFYSAQVPALEDPSAPGASGVFLVDPSDMVLNHLEPLEAFSHVTMGQNTGRETWPFISLPSAPQENLCTALIHTVHGEPESVTDLTQALMEVKSCTQALKRGGKPSEKSGADYSCKLMRMVFGMPSYEIIKSKCFESYSLKYSTQAAIAVFTYRNPAMHPGSERIIVNMWSHRYVGDVDDIMPRIT